MLIDPKIVESDLMRLGLDIANKCLEKHQERDENYLGLNLFFKLNELIDNATQKQIVKKIKDNDNIKTWETEYLEKLVEMKIIKKSDNGDKEG